MATMTINSGELNDLQAINLGTSVVDDLTACQAGQTIYHIPLGETFASTSVIWLNSDGTGVPVAGFYSDGIISRNWDGASVLAASTYCTNKLTSLSYHVSTPANACAFGPSQDVYIRDGENFKTASQMWLYPDETGVPPNGYYSDNGRYRFWNGTILGTENPCNNPQDIILGYDPGGDATAVSNACTFSGGGTTLFIPNGQSWSSATALYSDNAGTLFAAPGTYADGAVNRYWNGTSFGGGQGDGFC